jgi:hypothetical protein
LIVNQQMSEVIMLGVPPGLTYCRRTSARSRYVSPRHSPASRRAANRKRGSGKQEGSSSYMSHGYLPIPIDRQCFPVIVQTIG